MWRGSVLLTLCASQKLKDLNKTRASLCEAYWKKNKLDHLLCDYTPGIYLDKLMHQHTSYDHRVDCTNCGVVEYRLVIMEIRCDEDVREGKTLENYLHSEYFHSNMCLTCNEVELENTLVIGEYLALDFEEKELNISLNALPAQLIANGKKYLIAGLIEKVTSEIEEKYVSYT
ncbi:hypothetical protein QAD02_007585 [Eretmocerus hayati]|uniref:Uncharacterized protein n=1 Tax=Eretmocerus hayati TaxID=131215 RepID=A0ACC2N4R6_9HYME|nr:hypothetical protein QAD02_007585 [Eretmocerus hayati]